MVNKSFSPKICGACSLPVYKNESYFSEIGVNEQGINWVFVECKGCHDNRLGLKKMWLKHEK